MKPFPKIHDVYVGRVVFVTVLLVWAVLLGLDLMLSFVGEFGDIGKGNYGISTAIAYMAYTMPRQARYARTMSGFLAYMIGMNLMLMGTKWLEKGKIAQELGLWWLVLPLLGVALWLYFFDGRMRRAKLAS